MFVLRCAVKHTRSALVPGSNVILQSQRFFSAKMKENLIKPNRETKVHDNIVKSAGDKRDYLGIELKNGMKVVLVSDPTTDKSAAAVCVNVGYLCDPDDLPGLAHFCEHMLFLGTKKYPNENDYTKFLSEHGGSSNASTTTERTTYYFDVSPEHFHDALDRFAQFFIGPLFNEDATDREVKAVDSEHEKNLQSDAWRFDQLQKSSAKAGHPFRKFGTGNKMTLDTLPKERGINVREELLRFHKKWYSANIMTLAVLGKETIPELQKMVEDLFSDVENKEVQIPVDTVHPYQADEVCVKDFIVPIKDQRQLAVNFPIPNYDQYYTAGPANYLTHLVGHEGKGSLLSELRARSWCNSLSGGTRGDVKGFDLFCISVDLTEEGIDHVDDIVHLVFQYINMLKKEGPQKWVFDEHAKLLDMHFRFKDKSSPTASVHSISHKLLDYPFEDVLVGNYKLRDWRPDLIDELLGYLRPNNVRVSVVGKKFQSIADTKEQWYGTEFKLEKVEDSIIDMWNDNSLHSELHLPEKNEFIPTDFDITPRDEPHQFPFIILQNEFCRAWYKQDDEYLLPKANIRFEFLSPLAYQDPFNCNLTYMFVILFKDALLEYAYAAQLAGLRWELTNTKYGMALGIGGYNDKQKVFLEKVMDKMVNFQVDPKRFEILKEAYVRALKNFDSEQPYQLANYYLTVLLSEHSWTKTELLDATEQLTVAELEDFIKRLLSKMHVESFVHGNVNKAGSLDLVSTVMDRLKGSVGL